MAAVSLQFSGSTEGAVGRCSDISIYNDVVVMVFDKTLNGRLYYRVGTVDRNTDTTTYGLDTNYASGKVPSVTLFHFNNNYYVTTTHQPDNYASRACYFCIGTVIVDRNMINFGAAKQFRCAALKLKVSASDNGTVVIAHEKYYSSDKICYHIGTLDHQTGELNGIDKCIEITTFSGVQPSLDIHGNTVVMVYHSRYMCRLKSVVGTIRRNEIRWEQEVPMTCNGIYPSISINAGGYVVESHQSKFFRRIMRVRGQVQGQGIVWNNRVTSASFGEYPTLSLSDDGYIVEAHKTNFGRRLFLSDGKLNVRNPNRGNRGGGGEGGGGGNDNPPNQDHREDQL